MFPKETFHLDLEHPFFVIHNELTPRYPPRPSLCLKFSLQYHLKRRSKFSHKYPFLSPLPTTKARPKPSSDFHLFPSATSFTVILCKNEHNFHWSCHSPIHSTTLEITPHPHHPLNLTQTSTMSSPPSTTRYHPYPLDAIHAWFGQTRIFCPTWKPSTPSAPLIGTTFPCSWDTFSILNLLSPKTSIGVEDAVVDSRFHGVRMP